MTDAVYDRISDLKRRASFFVSQRRKDIDLYEVLADCMAICEQAEAAGMVETLKKDFLIKRQSEATGRVYFETDPDVYLVVGGLVFEPEVNRAACWRYTATLREAAKVGIAAADLTDWLRRNGGINALFKGRPVQARTARTKTLNLNTQVAVPNDSPFTLTLRRDSRGFFDVIDQKDTSHAHKDRP